MKQFDSRGSVRQSRYNSVLAFLTVILTVFPVVADDATPYGLDRRVPWTTSSITGSPEPPKPYRTQRAFPNLKFRNPLLLTSVPGTNRLAIASSLLQMSPNVYEGAQPSLLVSKPSGSEYLA